MGREMRVLESSTLRGIVNAVNQMGIQKDDIVALETKNDIHLLIYYGEN